MDVGGRSSWCPLGQVSIKEVRHAVKSISRLVAQNIYFKYKACREQLMGLLLLRISHVRAEAVRQGIKEGARGDRESTAIEETITWGGLTLSLIHI